VAGGTNTLLLPITSCTISSLGALSPVARCKTFDASADGCAGQHTIHSPTVSSCVHTTNVCVLILHLPNASHDKN
jgi:Beta-ketoacyl synthase, N-terminal domain